MRYNLKETEFSDDEKIPHKIFALLLLIQLIIIFAFLFLSALIKPKGIYYPYFFCAIALSSLLPLIGYIITYFAYFIKMKHWRIFELFILIPFAFASFTPVFLSGNLFMDIAAGTKKTATSQYKLRSYNINEVDKTFKLEFFDNEKKYIIITIPDNTAKMLEENAETGESVKIGNYFSFPCHQNNNEVEYYPNSKIFVDVKITVN